MANRFDFIKREFLSKNKERDGRIIVRIDNDDTWLWGWMSISFGDQGVTYTWSGSTVKEIDDSIEELDRLVNLLQEFKTRMEVKAKKVKEAISKQNE